MSNLTVELSVSLELYFIKFVELQLNYNVVSQKKKKKKIKHVDALNLMFFGKDNFVCIILFNTIMCLNLIREPKTHYLRKCIYVLDQT